MYIYSVYSKHTFGYIIVELVKLSETLEKRLISPGAPSLEAFYTHPYIECLPTL